MEHLLRLTEGRTSDSQLPNLVTAARSVRDAVYGLNKVFNRELAQSQDTVSHVHCIAMQSGVGFLCCCLFGFLLLLLLLRHDPS